MLFDDELRHGIDMALQCDGSVQIGPGPVLVTTLRPSELATCGYEELAISPKGNVAKTT